MATTLARLRPSSRRHLAGFRLRASVAVTALAETLAAEQASRRPEREIEV